MASPNGNSKEGPPPKKARTEEPRPAAKFEVDDTVIVQAKGEEAHESNSMVMTITETKYLEEPGFWQYRGLVSGTEISVIAPESSLRKPRHQVGARVETKDTYDGQGQDIQGFVKSIHTGEDNEVFYTVQTTFVVREGKMYPRRWFR